MESKTKSTAFELDLDAGKIAEIEAARIVEDTTGNTVIWPKDDGYEPAFDFKEDLRHTDSEFFERRYEVKFDRLSKTSGNVAIEYMYKGKPSGILATRSDVYVIVYHKEGAMYACFISRNVLLLELFNAIKDGATSHKITKGGDGLESKLLLLKVSHLETLSGAKICKLEQSSLGM